MVFEIPQERLRADLALWRERLQIGKTRYYTARNDEVRQIAAADIQDAKDQLAILRRLMKETAEPVTRTAPARTPSPLVRTRVHRVLYPVEPRPVPDRKRDRRIRDRERTVATKGHNPPPPQQAWRKKQK